MPSPHKQNLVVLSITICIASLSWTQIIPFLPKYLMQLGVHHNITAWSALVLGAHSVAGIVFMPLWGKLGDKYGRKPMVMRAGFCLTAIYIGMSFCTNAWHLVILRFMNGMLTGFLPGSFALIATNTPNEKAGRYVAIAQSAAAIGGIAGPIVGGSLADSIGIRGTMWVSGICVLLCTLAVSRFVNETFRIKPDKSTSLIQDFIFSAKNSSLRNILTHTLINSILAGAVTSTLIIYLSQIAPGVSGSVQGAIFAIPGILIAILALRWVKLGEKISYSKVLAIGLMGAGAFYVVMGLSNRLWLFVCAFVMCRIFATALNPIVSALISREVTPDFRGRAFGINTSVNIMGELVAQMLVATVGQFFGIQALYSVIGIGVCLLGIRNFSINARLNIQKG